MIRHNIYSLILESLEYTPRLKEEMQKRGIDWEVAYRDTALISEAAKSAIEQYDVKNVAGFYTSDLGKTEWRFNHPHCYLIPLKDHEGNIHDVKIRKFKTIGTEHKYMYCNTTKLKDGGGLQSALHFPKPIRQKDTIKTLRITEGEIKADYMSYVQDTVVTVSMGGITFFNNLRTELDKLHLNIETIYICFDADVYTKKLSYGKSNASKSLVNVYLTVKGLFPESTIFFEKWNIEAGKGIDDVHKNGNFNEVMYVDEAEYKENVKHVSGVPDGWVYIGDRQVFYDTDSEQMLTEKAFKNYYGSKSVKDILNNPLLPKFRTTSYEVDKGAEFINKKGLLTLNMFKGFPDIPLIEGDASTFEDHVKYIGGKYAHIILKFLAFNIQHPEKKIMWVLFLQGVDGTGKSYFAYIMKKLLGEHNVSIPSNETINEKYTKWVSDCCFVMVHEIMNFNRIELMNKLKLIITEDTLDVREMYMPVYQIPNQINLMVCTNHKHSISITENDRRWCVIFSKAKKKNASYYQNLFKWTDNNLGIIKHRLMNENLSDFDPYDDAPHTDGRADIIDASLNDDTLILKDSMINDTEHSDLFPVDIINVQDLTQILRRRGIHFKNIGVILNNIGGQRLKQMTIHNRRMRLWCVRNYEKYNQLDATQLKQSIEEMYKDVKTSLNWLDTILRQREL